MVNALHETKKAQASAAILSDPIFTGNLAFTPDASDIYIVGVLEKFIGAMEKRICFLVDKYRNPIKIVFSTQIVFDGRVIKYFRHMLEGRLFTIYILTIYTCHLQLENVKIRRQKNNIVNFYIYTNMLPLSNILNESQIL